jgi:predicted nucleic acid-binding protein
VRLAADANVLLSALIGGNAKRVLRHPSIEEILTTEVTLAEVQEYAGQLARKRDLAVDVVLLGAATLPFTTVPMASYLPSMPEARKRIGNQDRDDPFSGVKVQSGKLILPNGPALGLTAV